MKKIELNGNSALTGTPVRVKFDFDSLSSQLHRNGFILNPPDDMNINDISNNKPKINIVDPEAQMLHTSLGISHERSNELCSKMDMMCKEKEGVGTFMVYQILQEITGFCESWEEVLFCTITNTRWCERKGLFR